MCQLGVLVEVALLIDLVILELHSPCAPCGLLIYFVNIGEHKGNTQETQGVSQHAQLSHCQIIKLANCILYLYY